MAGNRDLLREIAGLTSDPAFTAGLTILPNPDEVSPAARTASTSLGPSPSTGASSTWGSPSLGSAMGCSS